MLAADGAKGETMRDTDLLQLALGLVPPWLVVASRFDPSALRLKFPGPALSRASQQPRHRRKNRYSVTRYFARPTE